MVSDKSSLRHNPYPDPQFLKGKKIIICLKSMMLGGAERQAMLLGELLAVEEKAIVEIWAFSPGSSGSLTFHCDRAGIPWRIVPFRLHKKPHKLIRDLIKLFFKFRIAGPDVLLAYLDVPNIACGLLWRFTSAGVFIWGQRNVNQAHINRRVTKWAVGLTPIFVSNSFQGVDFLIHKLKVAKEKIHVIHNGVKLDNPLKTEKHWTNHLRIEKDTFVACMIAHFSDQKDHMTLLKAWRKAISRLRPLNQKGVLILAGECDYVRKPKIMDFCERLSIAKYVKILENVQDVSGLLQIVDLCILCSHYEGLPNAVLEYMAAGLPVVGTDIPGIKEAIGPESHSFLVPPNNSELLGDMIIRFALDLNLRKHIGDQNRRRAQHLFDPARLLNEMVGLIDKGLKKSRVED